MTGQLAIMVNHAKMATFQRLGEKVGYEPSFCQKLQSAVGVQPVEILEDLKQSTCEVTTK